MIAIGIRYLCGYVTATDLSRRQLEWPVHPGRVFMAMAAAHFETGEDPGERAALQWLESQNPPAIRASAHSDRALVKTYVPVNDSAGGILDRSRQERVLAKGHLDEDTVFLTWNASPPETVRGALQQLCPKVTRIGHSSSLAQMWVVEDGSQPEANWVPQPGASMQLRVPSGGSLAQLDSAFNAVGFRRFDDLDSQIRSAKGRAKALLKERISDEFSNGRPEYRRPQLSTWQSYAERTTSPHSEVTVESPFDPEVLILARTEGRNLGLASTLQLTGALRNAAMKAAATVPEWLSGHHADGSPSKHPHAAFFPLPFVGREHADGHIMGLAIALPRGLDSEAQVLAPLFFDIQNGEERAVHLWRSDGFWDWRLEREKRVKPPISLSAETWARRSRAWASVTPVVLHHYPKKSRIDDVERIVREAFLSALLPEPEEVRVQSVSAVTGAGLAAALPPFREGGDGLCTYQTHVSVRFPNYVRGPVLVGRGRFRGYGLFRPMDELQGGSQ